LLRELIGYVAQRLMQSDVEVWSAPGTTIAAIEKALAAVVQEAYVQGISARFRAMSRINLHLSSTD